MTWSAPSERTSSAFLALHTPVTVAPSALAIWTAKVPSPPEAPLMSTRVPSRTRATSRMACSAVTPDMTAPPASSKDKRLGFFASCCAGTTVCSQKVPCAPRSKAPVQTEPNTSSPGARSVTPAPTDWTTPATSDPRTAEAGPRSPETARSA
jgi:hypothetical protein